MNLDDLERFNAWWAGLMEGESGDRPYPILPSDYDLARRAWEAAVNQHEQEALVILLERIATVAKILNRCAYKANRGEDFSVSWEQAQGAISRLLGALQAEKERRS